MGTRGPTRDLGPCLLELGADNLGETKGNTTFTYSQDTAPVTEDRTGTEPVDEIFTGSGCGVECFLSRLSLAELTAALPGASGSGTSGNQMVIRSIVGSSLRDRAKALVLKPVVEGKVSTDSKEWLTIFVAAAKLDLSVVYSVSDQRVYKVNFTGYRTTEGEVSGIPAGAMWKIGA